MKIARTPRTVHYILSPDKITSFAGLKLVADLAGKLGVLWGLERCTVKKRRRGIPAPDFVMSLVYNFIAGSSCHLHHSASSDTIISIRNGLPVRTVQ